MEMQAIGIDLGKMVFHLVGVDANGSVVVRKRCSRAQLLAYTANAHVRVIGMEACSGSHFLGRALREQGHDVRLMPAQYVKPYVKQTRAISSMRKRLPRRCSGPRCVLCRSKRSSNWICRRYTACASGG